MTALVLILGLLILSFFLYATVVSLRENERRAAAGALVLGIVTSLPFLLVALVSFESKDAASLILLISAAAAAAVFIIPFGRRARTGDDKPKVRIDERDTMFSRNALREESVQFENYYLRNPEKREPDDRFRMRPGLLSKNAKHYEPIPFSAAHASFKTVEALAATLKAESLGEPPVEVGPVEISSFIKRWCRELGAVSVGVTELADYHFYSVIGRGERYGQAVDPEHKFAIALTVEMEKSMIDSAPHGPTVMESAQRYLSAGTIAVQVAEFIRKLGYPARAHIDANYLVVCPLVARDAGLGEIGRMGLLMTPELGPRVRIAVVTTDMPLATDKRTRDDTMLDFCRLCRKCAEICPGKAIPFEDRSEIDGVGRWRIDSEACFTYWCSVGTDCALCVRACPYSHPSGLLHDIVRRGVRNSSLFRRFALKMDDFFYGRRPRPKSPPKWLDVSES